MRLDFGQLDHASQETLVTAQQELWPMLGASGSAAGDRLYGIVDNRERPYYQHELAA